MADRYWVGGTGNWDGAGTTHWSASSGGASGASVPTSSDNVIFDSASNATAYTVTITATASCNNLTIGNPASGALTFAGSSEVWIYGSLDASSSGISFTHSGTLRFLSVTGTKTITSNGNSFASQFVFGGVGGHWSLADSFVTSHNVVLTDGHFDLNDHDCTCFRFQMNTATDRTLSLGSGTARTTVTASATNAFDLSVQTNFTLSPTTGTLIIAGATSGQPTLIACSGLVFGHLKVGSGAVGVQIYGANTFLSVSRDGSTAARLVLPGSATTTITGTSPMPSGTSGNLFTIVSSSGSATVALSYQAAIDYVSLTNIVASGNTPAYAGTHSTNGGGNTNWLFTDAPSGGSDPVTSVFAPLLLLK